MVELEFVRTYAAPRQLVWDAWTEPDQIAQWWGPRGITTPRESIKLDLRPGGEISFDMIDEATGPWGKTTITVSGQDLTAMMDLEEWNLPYPNMPDNAIVELILAKYAPYGLIPTVVPTADVPVLIDRVPWQTGETDLAFIQRLAKRNGYVFYVEPGPRPGVSPSRYYSESQGF